MNSFRSLSARTRFRVVKYLAAACVIGMVAYLARSGLTAHRKSRQKDTSLDRYFCVRKGNFNISLVLDGTLDAIKRHNLKCEAKGRHELKIIEVVDDGVSVKKGDVVLRFSNEKYTEAEEKLKLDIEDERKNLRLAEEDLEMIKASNFNSIKFETDLLRSSRDALKKYDDEDAPQKKRDLANAITTAEEKLAQAKQELTDSKGAMSNAHMGDQSKLDVLEKKIEEAEKKVKEARIALNKAQYDLRVFKRYEHPQKLQSLRETTTKNHMNLQRDLVDATGKVIKAQRGIQNHNERLRKLQSDLKELQEDMAKLTITAPVDGIVTLGNYSRRRYWEEPKEIKVGTVISPGEILASIPDLSKFMVVVRVPEEYRSRVKVGLTASLRSKAVSDLILEGKITSIAPMAQHMIAWDENSPKTYSTDISTDSADKRLMPGMTMRVEIIVEEVKGVLFIPVEAVYNREGETYCKVRTLAGLAERKIEPGRTSNDYVEIISGLKAGDSVFLHQEHETATADKG